MRRRASWDRFGPARGDPSGGHRRGPAPVHATRCAAALLHVVDAVRAEGGLPRFTRALGVLAVMVAQKAPAGPWGLVPERFGFEPFPVRRRPAAIRSPPRDT